MVVWWSRRKRSFAGTKKEYLLGTAYGELKGRPSIYNSIEENERGNSSKTRKWTGSPETTYCSSPRIQSDPVNFICSQTLWIRNLACMEVGKEIPKALFWTNLKTCKLYTQKKYIYISVNIVIRASNYWATTNQNYGLLRVKGYTSQYITISEVQASSKTPLLYENRAGLCTFNKSSHWQENKTNALCEYSQYTSLSELTFNRSAFL